MENSSKKVDDYSDIDVFDDSALAANFDTSVFKDNSLNKNDIDAILNSSALSSEKETIGFDKITGKTWIYPTNYPTREYQFNIIKAAILKNTLVSLPTGLGKTFIAAVIMFNFYRWYPLGKIIFTAPTRPLVAQQIDACYNVVAIPPADTVEMTGHMQINTRKVQWETKRVFFATPQVIDNDIKSGICPADKIRCLVIDEAHKARGNYAYCQIISSLSNMGHTLFRILALSATPGSKVEDVIKVIRNLNIAHLELKTESSIDVQQYCHSREIITVIVKLGPELTKLRDQYVEILDVYARRLKQLNILPQNVGNLSKGRIVMMYKEFQSRERGARHPKHGYIMKDFTFLIALYHGLELLVKHGSRVFLNFFDEHPEKSWIQSDQKLMTFLDKLRSDLGINPLSLDRSVLPDGTIPEIPKNLAFGHPKFDKLKEIMLQHFNEAKRKGQETKAIVFCEYRESVNLVHCLLLQCRPLIVPQMFVGQSSGVKAGEKAVEKAGVSQRSQVRALRGFRAGASNALVCTCVAEEGLDVGAVDLILCFDVSTRSPIRLVQRCGRTGRSRGGHVYILVTEGREHQVLLDSMRQRDGLNYNVLNSKEVEATLYKHNPRMLPRGPFPECHKTFIQINKKDNRDRATTNTKKGQKDLRTMLLDKGAGFKNDQRELLTKDEFEDLYPNGCSEVNLFSPHREYWAMNYEKLLNVQNNAKIKLSNRLDSQRELHSTAIVGHSADTEILVRLLKLRNTIDDVPLPETQSIFPTSLTPNVFASPAKTKNMKKKHKIPLQKSPYKKDGDIRALFSTVTKSTKNYTKLINELGINNGGIPTKLLNIFVDMSVENKNFTKTCWACENICDCRTIQRLRNGRNMSSLLVPMLSEPYLPNISLIDDFDRDFLIEYCNTAQSSKSMECEINNIDDDNKEFSKKIQSDSSAATTECKNNINKQEQGPAKQIAINFDIGDVEDIFADSSSDEGTVNDALEANITQSETKNITKNEEKEIEFFHLNSIEDLFEDSDSDLEVKTDNGFKSNKEPVGGSKIAESDGTVNDEFADVENNVQNIENKDNEEKFYPTSPSILSGKTLKKSEVTSPILGTQTRRFNLNINKNIQSSTPNSAKKQLEMSRLQETDKLTPKEMSRCGDQFTDISSKSMLTITQTIDFINKSKNSSAFHSNSADKTLIESKDVEEIERTSSPILLTQRDRRYNSNTIYSNASIQPQSKLESVIILDSDSDSDFDSEALKQIDLEEKKNTEVMSDSISMNAQKEATSVDSPYFKNKLKLNNDQSKAMTLQKKILAALTSNEFSNKSFGNNDSHVNFMVDSPMPKVGKENKKIFDRYEEEKLSIDKKNNSNQIQRYSSHFIENPKDDKVNDGFKNNIEKLQMFKREKNVNGTNKYIKNSTNSSPYNGMKRKLSFSDSDDDFECREPRKKRITEERQARLVNHKVRKKNRKNVKNNEFLELEAELSDDGCSTSGDELSDDSVGSLEDFICDDSAALRDDDDMHALYLKSVKSPVKGVFKIPDLPEKFNKHEILSQTFVENDTYEMDSFCVDSNIGLTQVNEMSELEVAEMILEDRRKKKRSLKKLTSKSQANGDSPLFRKRSRNVKKQITSDSEDSS